MNTNIKTPDQRLRVFVSSTLQELSAEREAIKEAILSLHLIPVMFELGARPYPPRDLYMAYLQQSHIFVGIYWQQYGWLAPDMQISGLEDEFQLSGNMPKLIYIKEPSPERSSDLNRLLATIEQAGVSYKLFSKLEELKTLATNDLAILLTERFELSMQEHTNSLEADVLNEQLPLPPTSLIGREREVEEIQTWLSGPDIRLITLTGIGGIGKTRVALEVVRKIKATGQFRVCFVSLAGTDRADEVPAAILRAAFPSANATLPPLQLLTELLGNQRILLVLDNFEQIVKARMVVAELLANCPMLSIIVTSRERLHISSEVEFALQPLGWGSEDIRDKPPSLDDLSPAVRLFVQRAKSYRQDFQLDSSNYSSVVQICSALDGIPLAIELAASRIRLYTPSQILPMLEKRLDALKGNTHDIPGRHQTLRAMINWSFGLLPRDEQRLLCHLSVFHSGCSLEAAEMMGLGNETTKQMWDFPRSSLYVSASVTHDNAFNMDNASMDSVEALLSKSLVFTSVNKFGSLRINFYRTIQHYAYEELGRLNEHHEAHLNHLVCFLRLAEQTWGCLKSDEAKKAYETIDIDLDNINAALHWSVDHSPVYGLRLATAMAEYWDTRGRSDTARDWLEKLLKVQPALNKTHFDLSCIARLELTRALFRLADFDKAGQMAEQCAREARAHQRWHLLTDALLVQTLINVYAGQETDPEPKSREAMELARSLKYDMALLDIIQHEAADKIFRGTIKDGLQLAMESLELAQKLKAARWEVVGNILIGFGHFLSGALDQAESHFFSAIKRSAAIHDQMLPLYGLIGLGQIALSRQELTTCLTLLGCVQSFLTRPGITVVPIVQQLLSATLEQVNQIPSDITEPTMAAGRKLRLDEGIQFAMQEREQAGILDDGGLA